MLWSLVQPLGGAAPRLPVGWACLASSFCGSRWSWFEEKQHQHMGAGRKTPLSTQEEDGEKQHHPKERGGKATPPKEGRGQAAPPQKEGGECSTTREDLPTTRWRQFSENRITNKHLPKKRRKGKVESLLNDATFRMAPTSANCHVGTAG